MAGLHLQQFHIFRHIDDKRAVVDLDLFKPARLDFRINLGPTNSDDETRLVNGVAKLFEGVFHMFLQRLVADNHGLAWPLENIWRRSIGY